MANQFPTSKNSFLTGANSQTLSSVGHAAAHNAVETKIGIDNSADPSSLDYLIKNTASKNPGHYHTNGGPAFLVAASGASTFLKNKADYVCTGTNDEVIILQAIAALPANGGTIYLSEGTFNISATITVPSYVNIKGAGRRATRLFKISSGYYVLSFLGTSGSYMEKSTLTDVSIEGNAQTGGLVLCQYAQLLYFFRCTFDGSSDNVITCTQCQDSYWLQCSANTNHHATNPVIIIQGGATGSSNMLWFMQCRIEDFWAPAVAIRQGSGYSGNNNGFFFTECKFETTQAGGDLFTADTHTIQLHLNQIFMAASGFKSAYSTAVNGINSSATQLASYRDIYFTSAGSTTTGNSALKVAAASGVVAIDNVVFDGLPVTSGVIFNGTSGATFAVGQVATTGGGSAFSGDLTGINTVLLRTQFSQAFIPAAVTLTDASTIATDASLGNVFKVVLGGNRTLGTPTNPVSGQRISYRLTQDATGSRTITLSSGFNAGAITVTLTLTANKTDWLECIYNSITSKWDVVNFQKGY